MFSSLNKNNHIDRHKNDQMRSTQENITASAFFAVAVIIILAFFTREGPGCPKGTFTTCSSCGGSSNLQRYDSPHLYPYYESCGVVGGLDTSGRCATYCRASGDGGCAVACR